MNPLTRWNRAGLSRFRYIDGNAVTYLAELEAAYRERLLKDAPEGERDIDLLYARRGDDWGLELLRAFARSSHVVTEHVNDFANEMTVPTAARWESLRKLAGSVDYLPAPPVSASAYLALTVKEGVSGMIEPGLQVKSGPERATPLYFETLDEVFVDTRLNRFHAKGYNRNPQIIHGDELLVEGDGKDLKSGTPLLIVDEESGATHAAVLQSIGTDPKGTSVRFHPPLPRNRNIRCGSALVYVQPKVEVGVTGPASGTVSLKQAVMLTEKTDLVRGDIIGISDGSNTRFAKVRGVDGQNVIVFADEQNGLKGLGSFEASRTYVSRALEVSVSGIQSRNGYLTVLRIPGDWTWTAGRELADVSWIGSGNKFKIVQGAEIESVDYHPPGKDAADGHKEGYSYLRVSHADLPSQFLNPQKILVMPKVKTWKLDRFLDQLHNKKRVDQVICEQDDGIVRGEYAVIRRKNQLSWGRLDQVAPGEDETRCSLSETDAWGGGLYYLSQTTLWTAFKKKLRCVQWQDNRTPLNLDRVCPEDSDLLDVLVSGSPVFLDADRQCIEASITEVDKDDGWFSVTPKSSSGVFLVGTTTFIGNICKAVHGKHASAKTFSSGEAETPWFGIHLEETDISFVSNTAFSNGSAADVEVVVHGERWTQVERLSESPPAAPHFQVVLQSDGSLLIQFGDGHTGRMVSPGKDNVVVNYRRGCGLEGNCEKGTLQKMARKHGWIKSIEQPFPSFGGNSREPESAMRSHVADRLYAMDRAVSVEDFARLASQHSSVWQAAAFTGNMALSRAKGVRVVVVPAGGTELHEDLRDTLKRYLESRAIPGSVVKVSRYTEVNPLFEVELYARLDRYEVDALAAEARALLLERFGLKNSRLGEPLRIGDFYRILEAIEGVAHSLVRVDGQLLKAEWPVAKDAVACTDAAGSNLIVRVKEVE